MTKPIIAVKLPDKVVHTKDAILGKPATTHVNSTILFRTFEFIFNHLKGF